VSVCAISLTIHLSSTCGGQPQSYLHGQEVFALLCDPRTNSLAFERFSKLGFFLGAAPFDLGHLCSLSPAAPHSGSADVVAVVVQQRGLLVQGCQRSCFSRG
jgi:hypothetical protein